MRPGRTCWRARCCSNNCSARPASSPATLIIGPAKGMRALWTLVPLLALTAGAAAQQSSAFADPAATRAALRQALFDRREAEARSVHLEAQAQAARGAAERTAN